eukprot:UN00106
MAQLNKVIVIGGGLSGLSAAHTALEHGANVLLIEKNSFCGGSSSKATSGINASGTSSQRKLNIADNNEAFLKDTLASAKVTQSYPLAEVMVEESAPAIEWLIKKFKLDLSLVSRLGGHSFPRTHRGGERFPGMTITYALMEKYEEICEKEPHRAQLSVKSRAVEYITKDGAVIGVKYIKNGQEHVAYGAVVIATGGYAADYGEDSLLKQYRPDVMSFATTNPPHATGDGIKMGLKIGAGVKDMDKVQIHPTGLVNPSEPDNPVKFLAAEALRGVGGLLFDKDGKRFCNELGRRDYVSGEMLKRGKAPYYLVLNGKASKEIEWHCAHYTGRGLMKKFTNAADMAKHMGISEQTLKQTFDEYNKICETKKDPFDKQYFHNGPWFTNDTFHCAIVTPVRHYCMGGIAADENLQVTDKSGKPIPGLYATGEVVGGTHGANRLGGSSLLDCVAFGRVSGRSAAAWLLQQQLSGKAAVNGAAAASNNNTSAASTATAAAAPAATGGNKVYTLEEVAKHNKPNDIWMVVNGDVLNVTSFMDEHPGGREALLLFAGKDASAEFNMLHKPDVVAKFAPECIIGKLAGGAAKL